MARHHNARNAEHCDHPELRAWFAEIQTRLAVAPELPAGDVIASWTRVARPVAVVVDEPSESERRAHPGSYVRGEDGRWLQLRAEEPRTPEYDGPMDWDQVKLISFDQAGAYLWSDGRTVRDREQALRELDRSDWVNALVSDFFPSGRVLAARKGAMSFSLIRALALWSLQPLGQRRAARCVITWDHDLGPGLNNPDAVKAVRQFQAGRSENATDRRLRENVEWAVITASRRIWETIGLEDEKSFRI